jgi:peroxiredoxin
VGTLVRVGDAWRVVDLPEPIVEGRPIANGGLFYQGAAESARVAASESEGPAPSAADQKLYEQYEQLEAAIQKASPDELPQLHAQRAALFMQLIEKSDSPENRSNWVRQMADVTGGAFLKGDFPEGDKVLARNISALREKKVDPDDIAYAEYRRLSNYWSRQFNEATADEFEELQKQQLDALRKFVEDWPESEQSAEAMLQIGLQEEFDGKIREATEWYTRITTRFPETPAGRKARGARTRLESEGKIVPFTGTTIDGREFSLADQRGKVVLLQYWATWCEPCKEDLKTIAAAHEKFGQRGLQVVSISLDNSDAELRSYLQSARLPQWIHLYEEGGLDSPLAEQLGVTVVPTMILVGADGKVINRNLTASDLDRALSREFQKD